MTPFCDGGQLPFNLVVVDDLPNREPLMYSAQRPSERGHDQARQVLNPHSSIICRGPKSSNLTNDSHRCRRTQPVKINLLDMSAVSFQLVVETASGDKRSEYKPASHCYQKIGWALNQFEDSVSNFSFKTAGKFGLPPYVTQVTFGDNTITKTDTSFWQILVKNHNMMTPVGLYDYVVQDRDVVILRYMAV
ncbi:unnamed protein product [Boreogadus saida]